MREHADRVQLWAYARVNVSHRQMANGSSIAVNEHIIDWNGGVRFENSIGGTIFGFFTAVQENRGFGVGMAAVGSGG